MVLTTVALISELAAPAAACITQPCGWSAKWLEMLSPPIPSTYSTFITREWMDLPQPSLAYPHVRKWALTQHPENSMTSSNSCVLFVRDKALFLMLNLRSVALKWRRLNHWIVSEISERHVLKPNTVKSARVNAR